MAKKPTEKQLYKLKNECYCDRCCDVDSSDNFLFEEKKVK